VAPRKKQNFETQLEKLQQIVQNLEKEDLPLEEGVTLFKDGVKLAKDCRRRLEQAKNEVSLLTEEGLKEFHTEKEHD